ncbi:MAG TPA: DUF4157 domain-containing protein [Trebonia sp.]|nr:DUF4157 domain-containing protein [Trebonia sp.]
MDPAVQRLILSARGQGRPLPMSLRRRYRPGTGIDLASVRLHTGSLANALNVRFGSWAFTIGRDIFFRNGAYDPASGVGRELLRHELHHVAQQHGSRDGTGLLIQRAKGDAEKKPRKKRDRDDDDWNEEEEKKKQKHVPKPIPVSSLPRKDMEAWLVADFAKRGRPWADEYPKEVLVGVVVWNINHFSAEQKPGSGKAPAVDPAELAKNLETNIELVETAMDTIRNALLETAPPAEESGKDEEAGEANEEAEQEAAEAEDEDDTSKRSTAKQLNTDVAALRGNDLSEVIRLGLTARAAQADEGWSVAERALQLKDMRKLNQVWKRLDRISRALTGGTQQETALNALDGGQAAEILQNIQVMFTALTLKDLQASVDTLKRSWVIDVIANRFMRNKNIDLVLINEMNLGIGHLKKAVDESDRNLALSEGPIMLAKGELVTQKSKRKGKVTTRVGKRNYTATGKQHEYYPAVYRKGEGGLESAGTFYVDTGGEFIIQDKDSKKENAAIGWDKKAGESDKTGQSFRGVVVHRFVRGGQEFWTGVVHTTPAGSNLDRKEIWPQIRRPLTELAGLAQKLKIPLLVGGDFYISAEAVVQDPPEIAERKKSEEKRKPTKEEQEKARERRKATQAEQFDYIARYVFHVAGQNGMMQALLRAARMQLPEMEIEGDVQHRLKPVDDRAGYLDSWDEYVGIVRGWLEYQSVDKATETLEEIARELKINPRWNQTLAAGKITLNQFNRNPDQITLEKVLRPLGYRIVGGVGPTNPKDKSTGEDNMQVADIFIANEFWQTAQGGVPDPETGDILNVDDDRWSGTSVFWGGSDHSPPAIVTSTKAFAPGVAGAFSISVQADRHARDANWVSWDTTAARLDQFGEATAQVHLLIENIKGALNRPLRGPDEQVLITVKGLIERLLETIPKQLGENPDEGKAERSDEEKKAWQTLRADIAAWSPYYGLNFSNDRFPAPKGPYDAMEMDKK